MSPAVASGTGVTSMAGMPTAVTGSLSGLEFKDSNMKNPYNYSFNGLYGFLVPKSFRENHDFTL